MLEIGHAKDDQNQPVLNYSIAYDRNNREPLFYEMYPGSIVDVSQLQYMLEKTKGYGYRHVGFILDRGYFSKENIRYMDKCGYDFVIMMKGMKKYAGELIKSYKGTFEENRSHSIRDYKVSGRTVKGTLFPSDEKDRYFHIYIMTSGNAQRNGNSLKRKSTAWQSSWRIEKGKRGMNVRVHSATTLIRSIT